MISKLQAIIDQSIHNYKEHMDKKRQKDNSLQSAGTKTWFIDNPVTETLFIGPFPDIFTTHRSVWIPVIINWICVAQGKVFKEIYWVPSGSTLLFDFWYDKGFISRLGILQT